MIILIPKIYKLYIKYILLLSQKIFFLSILGCFKYRSIRQVYFNVCAICRVKVHKLFSAITDVIRNFGPSRNCSKRSLTYEQEKSDRPGIFTYCKTEPTNYSGLLLTIYIGWVILELMKVRNISRKYVMDERQSRCPFFFVSRRNLQSGWQEKKQEMNKSYKDGVTGIC